jgi:hypothetical protein
MLCLNPAVSETAATGWREIRTPIFGRRAEAQRLQSLRRRLLGDAGAGVYAEAVAAAEQAVG